jgi:hypothetical protein
MTRCLDCNGILKQGERSCFGCGATADGYSSRPVFGERFAWIMKVIFFASLTLTVASLFTDRTPPFSICLITSLILLLVTSSAAKMLEQGSH